MGNVLVIDDDREILDVMDVLLSTRGLTVKTQCCYEKAFNEIACFDPDVIVMDIDLGTEDGRLITRQIKSSKTTGHIPVILLSGVKDIDKDLGNCLNDDFISKPFEANFLYDRIEYHLQKNFTSEIISKDYDSVAIKRDASIISIEALYDKYAASLFAYLLAILKDKRKSEEILIILFKEFAENSQQIKEEKTLLEFIRSANRTILERYTGQRTAISGLMKNIRHTQSN
jgi:DNA-binding response OmpR family regulator